MYRQFSSNAQFYSDSNLELSTRDTAGCDQLSKEQHRIKTGWYLVKHTQLLVQGRRERLLQVDKLCERRQQVSFFSLGSYVSVCAKTPLMTRAPAGQTWSSAAKRRLSLKTFHWPAPAAAA